MRQLHLLGLIPTFVFLVACVAWGEGSPSPSASPGPKRGTGLEGVISTSPAHGGPIREDEPQTAPLAKAAFVVKQDEKIVAEFTTDEQGRFQVALPPGKYTVGGKNPTHRYNRYGPMPVEVEAGKMTSVKWDFDTGLR